MDLKADLKKMPPKSKKSEIIVQWPETFGEKEDEEESKAIDVKLDYTLPSTASEIFR